MVKIDCRIDLRTPECKAALHPYRLKFFNFLVILLPLSLLATMLIGFHCYSNYLESRVEALALSYAQYEEKVEPLLAMSLEIEQVEAREKLDRSLSEVRYKPSEILQVFQLSAPPELTFSEISFNSFGSSTITGSSRSIEDLASFQEELHTFNCIESLELQELQYEPAESYSFRIKAVLRLTEGENDHEKENTL